MKYVISLFYFQDEIKTKHTDFNVVGIHNVNIFHRQDNEKKGGKRGISKSKKEMIKKAKIIETFLYNFV